MPSPLIGKTSDHCLSHLEQAKYIRPPYTLVSGITEKRLQLIDGRKECKLAYFSPVAITRSMFAYSRVKNEKIWVVEGGIFFIFFTLVPAKLNSVYIVAVWGLQMPLLNVKFA